MVSTAPDSHLVDQSINGERRVLIQDISAKEDEVQAVRSLREGFQTQSSSTES